MSGDHRQLEGEETAHLGLTAIRARIESFEVLEVLMDHFGPEEKFKIADLADIFPDHKRDTLGARIAFLVGAGFLEDVRPYSYGFTDKAQTDGQTELPKLQQVYANRLAHPRSSRT
jgi:hypothetical protein